MINLQALYISQSERPKSYQVRHNYYVNQNYDYGRFTELECQTDGDKIGGMFLGCVSFS